MAARDETNVMVMLRLTSPSRSNVQKLEAIPPGQTPITSSPKPMRESGISSLATPNETFKEERMTDLSKEEWSCFTKYAQLTSGIKVNWETNPTITPTGRIMFCFTMAMSSAHPMFIKLSAAIITMILWNWNLLRLDRWTHWTKTFYMVKTVSSVSLARTTVTK